MKICQSLRGLRLRDSRPAHSPFTEQPGPPSVNTTPFIYSHGVELRRHQSRRGFKEDVTEEIQYILSMITFSLYTLSTCLFKVNLKVFFLING